MQWVTKLRCVSSKNLLLNLRGMNIQSERPGNRGRLPGRLDSCYTATMRSIELTLALVRHLPRADQAQVGEYIERLHEATRSERLEALRKTAGCLTPEEGAVFEQAIAESCERVDD